jgi:hypothetical protein
MTLQYKTYNLFMHANNKFKRGDFPFEPATGALADAYETRIRVTLNAISDSAIGRALLSSLSSWVPVYIVPFTAGGCNAITGQVTSNLTDGVRIFFSPETWAMDSCGRVPGYRPVETLFHELVHASRFTRLGFAGLDKSELKDMQDPEEFLAVMLTNVYRSEQGAKKFNRDYRTGALVSQVELESFLALKGPYLRALFDLRSDDLVRAIASLKAPFNPWRDYNRLKVIQNPQLMAGSKRYA